MSKSFYSNHKILIFAVIELTTVKWHCMEIKWMLLWCWCLRLILKSPSPVKQLGVVLAAKGLKYIRITLFPQTSLATFMWQRTQFNIYWVAALKLEVCSISVAYALTCHSFASWVGDGHTLWTFLILHSTVGWYLSLPAHTQLAVGRVSLWSGIIFHSCYQMGSRWVIVANAWVLSKPTPEPMGMDLSVSRRWRCVKEIT